MKRILQRLKHSPRRPIDKKYIIAVIVTIVVIAGSYFGYQTITGMHSFKGLDITQLEDQLYEDINQMRLFNQLDPLNKSVKLASIARSHSENMAYNRELEDRDYLATFKNSNFYCTFHGENILKTKDANILAELNDTHMANILDPKLERIGIGIAINKSIYITQDFCG